MGHGNENMRSVRTGVFHGQNTQDLLQPGMLKGAQKKNRQAQEQKGRHRRNGKNPGKGRRKAVTRANRGRSEEQRHELWAVCCLAESAGSKSMTILYVMLAVDVIVGVVLCIGLLTSKK